MSTRKRPCSDLAILAVGLSACWSAAGEAAPAPSAPAVTLETDHLRWVIASNGVNHSFICKQSAREYCAAGTRQPWAVIRKGGKSHPATACTLDADRLRLHFAGSGDEATIRVGRKKAYLTFEVVSISDPQIEEMTFGAVRVALAKRASRMSGVVAGDQFAACARALNLRTNLRLGGGPAPLVAPYACATHGLVGAKVAVVGCPTGRLRGVLQRLVKEEGLLWSPVGGPFALDAPDNRGSYVFATVSEKDVADWIALADRAGLTTIHMIGWQQSLGHYEPRKNLFPNGLEGLKNTVSAIHKAGLKAGMHTLTGGIAPHDPFVTPVPHKGLAVDAAFTLADNVDPGGTVIPTTDPPGDLDTVWAYAGRGNVVRIDDELIQYTGISREAPFGFTGCKRGAFGTRTARHGKGSAVGHLFVRYGLFQPDANSPLLGEVAQCIAKPFNACGFDMIYMDGLEGMSGGWHGVAKMSAGIFQRLKRRTLVEASNWIYHAWPYHSRLGAYDHPKWGLKRFVDVHCRDAQTYRAASLLATQLGWWAILGPNTDHRSEYPDEVEYLCCKSLAWDAPMSFQQIRVGGQPPNARQDEYLGLVGRYERLRLGKAVPESVLARLRAPREEFRLSGSAAGSPQFAPTDYTTHKVTGLRDGSSRWVVRNRFGRQPLRLRIEALYAAAPAGSPDGVVLARFDKAAEFAPAGSAADVTASLTPAAEKAPDGSPASRFDATSAAANRRGAWAGFRKEFAPTLDLSKCGAIGLWIRGDGKGQLINCQLTNPRHFWPTWDEHYADLDFKGWRYVELHLRERDAARFGDYVWPYRGRSAVFRSPLIRGHVSALTVYGNNLPPGEDVTCSLGRITALPVTKVTLTKPRVRVADAEVVLPVNIESGQYLELEAADRCTLYDERGARLQQVRLGGSLPHLTSGENEVTFSCDAVQGRGPRANVTLITCGEPLRP